MQTKMFHSFMSSMLDNLSTVQREFEENKSYSSDSEMSSTLETLTVQVNNLRLSLVKDYSKKSYTNPFGSDSPKKI